MAGVKTMETLNIRGDPQADEGCENIPPGVGESAESSKLKVQTESEDSHSSTQRCEENQPVSIVCTSLTPRLTRGGYGDKAKSQLSGLSTVLKSSNISNECPTPESSKHENSPNLSFAFHPTGFSTANRQKSKRASRRLICANDTTSFLLEDECLPEVSMLSFTTLELTTNDSVLSESVPATSKTDDIKQVGKNVGGNGDSPDLPQLVAMTESTDTNSKMDENLAENESAPAFTGILETEITLLDVSSNSELSPVDQMSSRNVLPDILQFDYLKVNSCSGEIVSDLSSSNTVLNEDLLSKSMQSIKSATESTMEVTPEVNGRSSSETSGQKLEKSQTSDEDKDGTQPANITRDISSSSDDSAHISTSGNTSFKKVVSEMSSESPENTNLVEKLEENQTCCDAMSTSEVSKQSPESAVSGNRSFTQTSSMNASSGCNTFTLSPCAENKTLDLPPVSSPKASRETESQTKAIATKTSFVVSQESSSEKESSQCGERLTFDKYSLQTTSSSSALGEAAVSFENKTFDCKSPLKNGTQTLSEISSTDRHHTFDLPPSPKLCNLTTSLKHEDSSHRSSEPSKCEAATASEPSDKKVDKHNGTFEANTASERVSGDGGCEMKDLSPSGRSVTDASSSTSNSQCVDVVDCKAAFNLDETLDLRADNLITSTPMPNYKMFNFGSEGKVDPNPAAQKKCYKNGPSKPTDEAAYKTLKQPAVKSLLKAAPQLLNKSGSAVPGQLKRVTSGLPLKRFRLQAGAGKTSAASEESQGTVVTSSSYNLRSLTAASKLPSSGLYKQQSRIPFGIPRAASGLAASARFGALASSTNKSSGPSAAVSVTKQSLGKKHLLPKGEAFPASKKKKTDAAVPATTAAVTCDRPSRAVKPSGANQRAPVANPQHPVCTKCIALEEEVKIKSAKIQRLEEELLKYRTQEDS